MESTLDLQAAISFAIKRGATSLAYYTRCASSYPEQRTSKLFQDLRSHERAQQGRLLVAKDIISSTSRETAIPFGRIRTYLVDAKPGHAMTIVQSLFWAAVRSETSLQLYHQIGQHVEEDDLKSVFLSMANEERKSKRAIEEAYDQFLD